MLLSAEQIQDKMIQVPGWTTDGSSLRRAYQFRDFIHAFGFMSASAVAIEKINHHPEWTNTYNRVDVTLTTHDAGGVTQADFDLAVILDTLAAKLR
jgi:4a-hydroxytetrahydrobiopterin dehydratase